MFRNGILPGKPVIGVNLDETQANDDDLADLKLFPQLQSLSIDETRITDAGLVHIKPLTSLTELSLDDTGIGDAGIAHLNGLVNLRKLTLAHTKVTDAGLVSLEGFEAPEDAIAHGDEDHGRRARPLEGSDSTGVAFPRP